jgi:putative molybdopterin biosynthesis protein
VSGEHDHGHGRKHFLAVVSKEEAERRWYAALEPKPLGTESVALEDAHGRTLGADVIATIDLPPFDRAVVDGFAVQARDTFAAEEGTPVSLGLEPKAIAAGDDARGVEITAGRAVEVATGAPVPRGANAVVMVEHSERRPGRVLLERAATPGEGIQLAGSDVRRGETILRRGDRLGARETCVLAALGIARVSCFKKPRVAVISTGDELVQPGVSPLAPGQIYDSNARLVADLVREHGGEPTVLGRARDDLQELREILGKSREFDVVVLSGGTSKGAGDLTFRLVDELGAPGILVHGVALKPGKPTVLAAWDRTPVVILPGFPTSCAITFDVFVKPLVRTLAGLERTDARATKEVRLAATAPAGQGRHEYVLCHLVARGPELWAFPLLKGSGSVAAFAQADAFIEVPPNRERAERGELFRATVFPTERPPADLAIAASPDPGLDALVSVARLETGVRLKVLATSSAEATVAVADQRADLALSPSGRAAESLASFARRQVLAARPGVLASLGDSPARVLATARERGLRLVSRHRGSSTRARLDELLAEAAKLAGASDPEAWRAEFPGALDLARTHEGAATAVALGTADLTLCLEAVAKAQGLETLFVAEEIVHLFASREGAERAQVRAVASVFSSPRFAAALAALPGFRALGAGAP